MEWLLKRRNRHLIKAAKKGQTRRVIALLATGADAYDKAMSDAIGQGHVDVVRVLLAAGANVHAGGRWARSDDALVHAVIGNQVPILGLLLAAGGNASAGDGWPLRWAVKHGYEIAEVLREAIAAANPLSAGNEHKIPIYSAEDLKVLLREATAEQALMGGSTRRAAGATREYVPMPHL